MNTRTRQTIVVVVGLLIALVIFLGNFHIVTGSNFMICQFVAKSSFSLNETFINLDEITSMPALFARVKYPMAIKDLQKTGYLESDEQIQQSMQKKINDIINPN